MKSPYDYIVKPYGDRYNNSISIGDKSLITNTEASDHRHINRIAEVIQTPIHNVLPIKNGDKIILHHNVFRRMLTIKGKEVNARSFLNEDEFIIRPDQVFMYKRSEKWSRFKESKWQCVKGYTFIQPVKNKDIFSLDKEEPMKGIIRYIDETALDMGLNIGDLVGFQPYSDYEFIVDGVRLYRVYSEDITISYEYKGDEEAYNPSWAEGS